MPSCSENIVQTLRNGEYILGLTKAHPKYVYISDIEPLNEHNASNSNSQSQNFRKCKLSDGKHAIPALIYDSTGMRFQSDEHDSYLLGIWGWIVSEAECHSHQQLIAIVQYDVVEPSNNTVTNLPLPPDLKKVQGGQAGTFLMEKLHFCTHEDLAGEAWTPPFWNEGISANTSVESARTLSQKRIRTLTPWIKKYQDILHPEDYPRSDSDKAYLQTVNEFAKSK